MPNKQPDFELAVSQQAQNRTNYTISVNGWVWKADAADPQDSASGGQASGSIWGGEDVFKVRGWVTGIDADGPMNYTLDGNSRSKQQVLDYRPKRFRDGSSSGSSSSSGASGGSPTRDSTQNYDADLTTADEYASFFDGIAIPNDEQKYARVGHGEYNPPAIQRTLIYSRPEYSIAVEGDEDDPFAVDLSRANHNLLLAGVKDEHSEFSGMTWGRTQLAGSGDPFMHHMVFTDRHRPNDANIPSSSVGGKRASGRYQDCYIGHPDDPDDYAAYYYGSGEVNFKARNEFRARGDCYIQVSNTVTLYIHGSNEFLSGDDKEVVGGSGVYPDDLDSAYNVFEAGQLLGSDGWL